MYYYQKHISDFNNATRHLTRVERSLFSDAIELYYDTEKPLTLDFDRLSRLLLANTTEEKAALRDVLNEFFTLTDDGYFNKRCNEEIIKYHGLIENKSMAGKASAEKRNQHKSTGVQQVLNECATNHEPRTMNQEPITNNQKNMEVSNIYDKSNIVTAKKEKQFFADIPEKVVNEYLAVRKKKRAVSVSEIVVHGLQREADKAGITLEQALIVCIESSWISFKAEWYSKSATGSKYKNKGLMSDESFDKWLDTKTEKQNERLR